jgi:Na+/proline symporter
MESKTKKRSLYSYSGIAFTGCMFFGMGIGSIFGHRNDGMFIGMGLGFILMTIIYISQREQEQ